MNLSVQSGWVRGAVLLALCLALWLPGMASLPPFDRDESRFAQATHQMVESGDYINIRFQDQARNKKPVGIYWLQAASVKITGAADQIWAYRIPSLLGAIVTVLLTAQLGARFISPLAGLLAGGLLASCLLLGIEARMAKTDAMLLASITGMMFALTHLYLEKKLSAGKALAFWVALALGILIKGPIILIPLAAALVLIWREQISLRLLRPLWGAPLLIALVAPWLIAITISTHGAFWAESVGHDLAAKVAGGQEGHGAPPGFYLGTFFITFWPWAPLLLAGVPLLWQHRRTALVKFLFVWWLPLWLVFELTPTKLMHYTMPTFPALALLAVYALGMSGPKPLWLQRLALALAFLLVTVVAIAVPLAPLAAFAERSTPPAQWLALLGQSKISMLGFASGLLLIAASVVAWSLRLTKPALAGTVALTALLNFYAAVYGQMLPRLDALWLSRSALQTVYPFRAICPGPVASIGYSEPSLVFLLGTNTQLLSSVADLKPVTDKCQLVLIEEKLLADPYKAEQALANFTGFNYSKGDPLKMYLFMRKETP